jgi:hypothetical protein
MAHLLFTLFGAVLLVVTLPLVLELLLVTAAEFAARHRIGRGQSGIRATIEVRAAENSASVRARDRRSGPQ